MNNMRKMLLYKYVTQFIHIVNNNIQLFLTSFVHISDKLFLLMANLSKYVPYVSFPSLALLKSIDRKSTRLNSSHVSISYAVFCLKKKKFYIDALINYI